MRATTAAKGAGAGRGNADERTGAGNCRIAQGPWSEPSTSARRGIEQSTPDKYRVAIVLCDLEGKTRKRSRQATRRAGGTLAARGWQNDAGAAASPGTASALSAGMLACGLALGDGCHDRGRPFGCDGPDGDDRVGIRPRSSSLRKECTKTMLREQSSSPAALEFLLRSWAWSRTRWRAGYSHTGSAEQQARAETKETPSRTGRSKLEKRPVKEKSEDFEVFRLKHARARMSR